MTNTTLDREHAATALLHTFVVYRGPNGRWHHDTLYVAAALDGYVYLAPDEDSNVVLAHVKVEHVTPLPS